MRPPSSSPAPYAVPGTLSPGHAHPGAALLTSVSGEEKWPHDSDLTLGRGWLTVHMVPDSGDTQAGWVPLLILFCEAREPAVSLTAGVPLRQSR